MKDIKAVNVKGKLYDSVTGMPIKKLVKNIAKPQPTNKSDVVTNTHSSLAQRSQAFYHRASEKTALHSKPLVRKIGRSMDIARSKSITRFNNHVASHIPKAPIASHLPKSNLKAKPDTQAIRHPLVAKTEHIRSINNAQKPSTEVTKSSKLIKEEAIMEALKKASDAKPPKTPSFLKRHRKSLNFFTLSVFILLVTGIITYYNMPNISVLVASAQAGINAKYPEYQPDGYRISGPISYQDGEVTINFHANTGETKFTIKQSKSSWDSSAVKNMVNKESKGQFITTEERGLTIFTYNGNAAWVNGGILYTISGNATLSSDQVRRIATNL